MQGGPQNTARQPSLSPSEVELHNLFEKPDLVNDGFTTYDENSSEEEALTEARGRPRSGPSPFALGPSISLASTAEREDTTAHIFQRVIKDQRNPKYADIEAALPATPIQFTPAQTPPGLHIFEILHNWTQDQDEEQLFANINIVERDFSAQADVNAIKGHVGWVHAEEYRPSLENFEKIFTKYLSSGLAHHVTATTQSLLKRVEIIKEKRFVGGRFLVPGAIRYDGRKSQEHDHDHPCTFFSFPYLAVGNREDFNPVSCKNAADPHVNSHQKSARKLGSLLARTPTDDEKLISNMASPIHPVRMLIQSRYRLESTKKRDGKQSITTLSKVVVKDCIRLPRGEKVPVKGGKWKGKLHVPQLWCLSISGDTMITSAPISFADLCSSSLKTKVTRVPSSEPDVGPSIVRINIDYEGRRESFIYPADKCECYFGLLNKSHKVLDALCDKKGQLKYRLYHKEEGSNAESLVTSENWIDVLRCETSEQLDLWMKRELPEFELPEETTDENEDSGTSSGSDSAPGIIEQHKRTSHEGVRSPALLQVPSHVASHHRGGSHSSKASSTTSRGTVRQLSVFTSLLQWPMQEDRDGSSTRSAKERVEMWLDSILRNTLKIHDRDVDDSIKHLRTTPSTHRRPRSPPNRSGLIVGCRREDVRQRFLNGRGESTLKRRSGGVPTNSPAHDGISSQPIVNQEVQELFNSARQLLRLFVPESVSAPESDGGVWISEDHTLVLIYWNLVDQIVLNWLDQRLSSRELRVLLKAMSDIIGLAELLHRGVRKYKLKRDDGTTAAEDVENVTAAVMKTPIPAALEHTILFLFSVIKYSSRRSQASSFGDIAFTRATGPNFKAATRDLKMAQNYLIAATDESDKGLGPIVTPEAILLILLERLSRGVYKNGSIDVIDLYERIVEKLASEVDQHASRHLLLEIDHLSEEIDIILDVLNQQKRFFDGYREVLDPELFERPSMKRKTRYPYEQNAINRISKAISERINYCRELQTRTARLAEQNVRLVETFQDDNNRTLLIFTMVTIIFLPLSFITGYFGMNIQGLDYGSLHVRDFWRIAGPVTGAAVVLCIILARWGNIRRVWIIARHWL